MNESFALYGMTILYLHGCLLSLPYRGQCEVNSIECTVVEEMGEDDHVPKGIHVHCCIRGANISDRQLKRLKRAIEGCPIKRIITGASNRRNDVAGNEEDYIRSSLKFEDNQRRLEEEDRERIN